jgi:hypothetical protein
MIWLLLEALENPHEWAMHRDRDGTIHIAPVSELLFKGVKVIPIKDKPA